MQATKWVKWQRRASAGAVLLALLVAIASGPARTGAQTPTAETKPNVVATFSVLGDLVRQVGGDAIGLSVLVGAGADAHNFEPSPANVTTLEEADLVFENGLGFEAWLDDLYAAASTDAERIMVSQGIDLLAAEDAEHEGEAEHETEENGTPPSGDDRGAAGEEHEEGEEAAEHEEGEHGELDPHVWHDVENAIVMVGAIRDALVVADPANAAAYERNAGAYMAELRELDAFVVEQVATLPAERRMLVTSHDTFGYFARRYGFEVVGTALPLSTEAGEPSAAAIAELVDRIEAAGVPAIFAENVQNPDLMESIATEAGVDLAPPLFTDALGPAGSGGERYVDLMRSNVVTIVTALGAGG